MDLLNVILEQLMPLLEQAVIIVFGIITTWLGFQAKKVVDKINNSKEMENIKAKLENNKELALISVEYVEQVAKHLVNDEKKELAKIKFLEFAEQYGIVISDTELDTLIEQAVHAFKTGYNSEDGVTVIGDAELTIKTNTIEGSVEDESK